VNRFRADWFDGRSARAVPVEVCWDSARLQGLERDGGTELFSTPLSACRIEPPLGTTARHIHLPGGGCLESRDLEGVAALERLTRRNRSWRGVHRLESSPVLALTALGIIILAAWLGITFGIPLLADRSAEHLPRGLLAQVSRQTFATLEEHYLAPSQLPPERCVALENLLWKITGENRDGVDFRLECRRGVRIGANAFALPDGRIVITDQLVELAESDEELEGVLAHEAAHVRRRHAARSLLRNLGARLLASVVLGDASSVQAAFASFPMLLVETGYAREFEYEADRDAGRYLLASGRDTAPFRRLLQRLGQTHAGAGVPTFIATHPPGADRIKALTALEH
jgi:hypothetical protein